MSINAASSIGFSSIAPSAQHRHGPRPDFPVQDADAPGSPRSAPPGQQLTDALRAQLLRWQTEFPR